MREVNVKGLCLALVCVCLAVVACPARAGIIFEDDFEDGVINAAKWTLSAAEGGGGTDYMLPGGPVPGGYVTEGGGILDIVQNITNFGGRVISSPITVNPTGVVTVSRRTLNHRGPTGDPLYPGLFYQGKQFIRDQADNYVAHVGYYDFHWFQYQWEGFGQLPSPLLPTIFDQWFDEVLTYDPATGNSTYSINGGAPVVLAGTALVGTTIELDFHSYGWWTGHYTQLEYVTVEQENLQPPVAEPATLSLLALGGMMTLRRRRRT